MSLALFNQLFAAMPLIAILRGITPATSQGIDEALVSAGIALIEVPLNSPDALVTIKAFSKGRGAPRLIGAGTVLTARQCDDVAGHSGQLVVSPNCNLGVIRRAKALNLVSAPGVMTPSEAFAALDAGADALKLFPAEVIPPQAVKAMRAVLPKSVRLIIVGGVTPQTMLSYLQAGADGFGIGSALYAPGDTAAQAAAKAHDFVSALEAARAAAQPR